MQLPRHNVNLSLLQKLAFLAAATLLLLPLLTYPVSLDLAVFARGGEVLLKGGTLYTDYIDLKPPLIHYLLAFAQMLTPAGETGLRVFDLVWQLITVISFAKIVSKITSDERIGYTAAVLYALVYTAGFYEATFQCESFLSLPIVLLFYIQVCKSTLPKLQFALGALIGMCIGFKYTFAIIAIIWLLDEILLKKTVFTDLLKNSVFVSLGIIFTLAFVFIPTVHSVKTLSDFKEIIEYTSRYAALPVVDKELIRSAVFKTGGAVVGIYSFSYVFFAMFSGRDFFKRSENAGVRHAVFLAIISIFFLILSAVMERKFFDYHYTRAYIPLCFLAAVGIIRSVDFLKNNHHSFGSAEKFLLSVCLPVLIIYSPLLSWGSLIASVSKAFFKDKQQYHSLIERSHIPGFKSQREQQKEVVGFFKNNNRDKEKIFVIGMDAARIGYFLQSSPVSKFATAQFYLGSTASQQWRLEALEELKTAQWLVGQNNDSSPYAYDGLSAWQAAVKDSVFGPYIYANFAEVKNTGYYHILKRK